MSSLTDDSGSPWVLDPSVDFLNHGSFGSCPRVVLQAQRALQDQLERQPVRFLVRELEGRLDEARTAVAAFVGADPEGLAFVSNATAGVNTVVRSIAWAPGDELITTDHAYPACANALRYAAGRAGARVIVAHVPFPLSHPSQVVEALLSVITPRTRLALVDHITSPTGLVFPLADIVSTLQSRGVDVLVDGAHGPGMVPLDLTALGAAYYTGNLHKWVCAPKGAAFLHVREDRREGIRPLVISHGAESPRTDRSRFRLEFDWTGTVDPTPVLVTPVALSFLGAQLPDGWPAWMARNRALALAGRDALCSALSVPPPAPDSMIAALAAVGLPDGSAPALQDELMARHGIEVPIVPWPSPPARLVRIAAQAYNHLGQYTRLGEILRTVDR